MSTNGQKVLLASLAPYMQDIELARWLSKLGMNEIDLPTYAKQAKTSRFNTRMRTL